MSPAVASSGSTSLHSMESACLFICSPSPPSAKRRQEETSDEECDSLSDNHIASKDVTQCCSHSTLTGGDTPKAMLIKSPCKESVDELVISESESSCFLWFNCLFSLNVSYIFSMCTVSNLDDVEDVLTCALPGNLVDPAESHMVEFTQIKDGYFNIVKGLLLGSLNGY